MFSAFLVIFGILFIAYAYSYSVAEHYRKVRQDIQGIHSISGAAMVIVLFMGGVSGFDGLWDTALYLRFCSAVLCLPGILTCINVVTLIQNRTEKRRSLTL